MAIVCFIGAGFVFMPSTKSPPKRLADLNRLGRREVCWSWYSRPVPFEDTRPNLEADRGHVCFQVTSVERYSPSGVLNGCGLERSMSFLQWLHRRESHGLITLLLYFPRRGAFLLAVDGGLNGGDGIGKGEEDSVVQLPTDGPTCLKKVPQTMQLGQFRTYKY